MKNNNEFYEKAIIIADSDEHRKKQIRSALDEEGFRRLIALDNQMGVVKKIAAFWRRRDEIGLIIINESLLDCAVPELFKSLGGTQDELDIPLFVLVERRTQSAIEMAPGSASQVTEVLIESINDAHFLSLVNFAITLKTERDLRQKQEDQLVSELTERRIMEARLKYLVTHDELTGLGNRRSLEKNLEIAIHRCTNFNQSGALLYLDLDRFNIINDIEGYDAGDRLLVEVVGLIRSALTSDQYIARIGADEFCIYLNNSRKENALATAERLRVALDEFRFIAGNDSYHVSASIGIALLTPRNRIAHPSKIIVQAHQACFVAKSHGRNLIHLFNQQDIELRTRQNDAHWVQQIREALLENRFHMEFQPVVRVSDGHITHYEVLVRMQDNKSRVFKPDEFIPVAERTGLIHHIDLWVVENAIDFLASLPDDQSYIALTINLSSLAFQEKSLLPLIMQKLDLTWADASRITFEITETETAAVANFEQTRGMVARIRALGCHFALDDFGTGFSSFNYLKNFPVDYVKIDGQFIQNLIEDETDQVLVKAMIEIAHKLGKRTVAEFVEKQSVFRLLESFGIDYVQGFLLGKPSPELLPSDRVEFPNSIERSVTTP